MVAASAESALRPRSEQLRNDVLDLTHVCCADDRGSSGPCRQADVVVDVHGRMRGFRVRRRLFCFLPTSWPGTSPGRRA